MKKNYFETKRDWVTIYHYNAIFMMFNYIRQGKLNSQCMVTTFSIYSEWVGGQYSDFILLIQAVAHAS